MQYDRPYNDEINIGDLFTKFGEYRRYLVKKWWVILIAAILLAIGLRFFAVWKKEYYISHADFAVKGTEGSSTSSLASLASSFGIGITTGTEFTNELFLGILQSRTLVKEALMEKRTLTVKKGVAPREDYLANFYVEMYPRWAKKKKVKNFKLEHGSLDSLTVYEDSCLTVIYDEIIENDISTEFSDDLGMNQMEVSSLSRDFSYYLADYLAYAGSNYYINAQVVNEQKTVNLMSEKADSLRALLDGKEELLARIQDGSAYQVKLSGYVNQNRLIREIGLITTEYSTTYAQLQLALFDLQNKTPLVDMIDQPKFATIKEKEQTTMFMIIGFILGTILTSIVLAFRKYIRDSVEEARQKQLVIEKYHKEQESQSLIDTDSNKI
ncbi:MAG TPA: hypothetical protein PK511_00745 [Chitinophagales bacterium]|nr:hypothetical protein [Chitinophagales bacterium]HMX03441.1 hypothetical protein [Chitinophagales bacterium]HMZ88284.1 hypothetical protein [Chitinophagales bacterium]HNE44853.1 hypothetical protein [Chitinophagales bacterium]HNF67881.1 hypothetical protein [Chitinophagales bacterium]